MTKKATAYSPSHITGFFSISENSKSPLRSGSLGAGVCLEKGITTQVTATKSRGSQTTISVNGISNAKYPVSELVVKKFLQKFGELRDYNIHIDHHIEVPVGAGFGSSGGSALSLALAMNRCFDIGMSYIEASQIAHLAEIECKTGLGTVIAESVGGIEVRTVPGAPGIGKVIGIPFSEDDIVFAISIGKISTKNALSKDDVKRNIRKFGQENFNNLIAAPDVENFMRSSRSFSDSIGLETKLIERILKLTDSIGVVASMPMVGEGIFTIIKEDDLNRVRKLLSEENIGGRYIISKIASKGARVID